MKPMGIPKLRQRWEWRRWERTFRDGSDVDGSLTKRRPGEAAFVSYATDVPVAVSGVRAEEVASVDFVDHHNWSTRVKIRIRL